MLQIRVTTTCHRGTRGGGILSLPLPPVSQAHRNRNLLNLGPPFQRIREVDLAQSQSQRWATNTRVKSPATPLPHRPPGPHLRQSRFPSPLSLYSKTPPPPPQDHVYFSPPQYIRPPRLPLPIETEPVIAGSPIISPADLVAPVELDDPDEDFPRKTSLLSSVTGDDDYAPDEPHLALSDRPAIPTLVEWSQGGYKVYVTGTFTNWDKKYRLHREYVCVDFTAPLHPRTSRVIHIVTLHA